MLVSFIHILPPFYTTIIHIIFAHWCAIYTHEQYALLLSKENYEIEYN